MSVHAKCKKHKVKKNHLAMQLRLITVLGADSTSDNREGDTYWKGREQSPTLQSARSKKGSDRRTAIILKMLIWRPCQRGFILSYIFFYLNCCLDFKEDGVGEGELGKKKTFLNDGILESGRIWKESFP